MAEFLKDPHANEQQLASSPVIPGGTTRQDIEHLMHTDVCQIVANAIQHGLGANDVADIITQANDGKHLFHGIRKEQYMQHIRLDGIRPLTPQGQKAGGTSFWSTGQSLFGTMVGGTLETQQSTLFNYAHSYEPSDTQVIMNMAITNVDAYKTTMNVDVPFKPNAFVEFQENIPRSAFHLLRVVLEKADFIHLSGRELYALAEKKMLELLHTSMMHGYVLGEETSIVARPTEQ